MSILGFFSDLLFIRQESNIIFVHTLPLFYILSYFNLKLFSIYFNKKLSFTKKVIFILINGSACAIMEHMLPVMYFKLATIAFTSLLVMITFWVNAFKALLSQFFYSTVFIIVQLLAVIIFKNLLELNFFRDIAIIISFRLICTIFIAASLKYIGVLINIYDINTISIKKFGKIQQLAIYLFVILGFSVAIFQFYSVVKYSGYTPNLIMIINIISILIYFVLMVMNFLETSLLEHELENKRHLEDYNKSLLFMNDNVRCLKHDLDNIVQTIYGYAVIKDLDGLTGFCSSLVAECKTVNNIAAIHPDKIKNPALYSMLMSKYYYIEDNNIKFDISITSDLSNLNIDDLELIRIIGILMDNAVEACRECKDKKITLDISYNSMDKEKITEITNTYMEKDIDLDKIYEKTYSTKKGNTGLGLWKVKSILNKHKHMKLETTFNEKIFIQRLHIKDM